MKTLDKSNICQNIFRKKSSFFSNHNFVKLIFLIENIFLIFLTKSEIYEKETSDFSFCYSTLLIVIFVPLFIFSNNSKFFVTFPIILTGL